ncbi:MAG: hypothetical protein JSU03_12145 [Bacteroidetes bacterium]|nr:hypothetical protein [Bacteroidota bacterium]
MTKKQINNLLGILLMVICCIGAIWGIIRRNALRENHIVTTAIIKNCQNGSRGNGGSLFFDYSINIVGKNYNASSSYQTNEISFFSAEKYFVNKTFPAIYYPLNPSVSSILITPKDFERYGYAFPDSLKWVLQYFKEK